MADKRATERPGPFAEDPSRTPPTKEQRARDYTTEKKETGDAAKGARLSTNERE